MITTVQNSYEDAAERMAQFFELSAEYFYAHITLCVIDAVFSIGVNYEGTRRTVRGWAERSGWVCYREYGSPAPPVSTQHTISDFLASCSTHPDEVLAEQAFANRQRTSPRSGVLKAAAVIQFANTLRDGGIETFQDFQALSRGEWISLRQKLTNVHGQKSGLSADYFAMLAGDDDGVKPDRMVL